MKADEMKDLYEREYGHNVQYGHTDHGIFAEGFVASVEPFNLLDVGGGRSAFAARCAKLFGLEHAEVLDIVDIKPEDRYPHVTYTQGTAWELPYENMTFDVVTAFDVLEHMPPDRVRQVIGELHRVAIKRVVLSIAFGASVNHEGVDLHLTRQGLEWWLAELRAVFARVWYVDHPQTAGTGRQPNMKPESKPPPFIICNPV